MKNVLITGGSGYIGTHIITEISKDDDYGIIILDNFSNSNLLTLNKLKLIIQKPVKIYNRDCRDIIDDIFIDNKIDCVIHLAAFKSVDESIKNPLYYYDNNINSLLNILKNCKKYNVNNILFSSSCSLYGDVKELPVNEKTPIKNPKSPYANTKLISEQILKDFQKSNKEFNIISLRYFNPLGSHESGLIGDLSKNKQKNILSAICESAKENKPISVFGYDYNTSDGSCVRDYIHVSDLANAHYLSLNFIIENSKLGYEVFNIGSDKGYSVLELIKYFQKENSINLNVELKERRIGDIDSIYSDSKKAKKILNWKPKKTIKDIVTSAWEFYNNN